MARFDAKTIVNRITRKVGEAALSFSRPVIRKHSSTLANSVQFVFEGRGKGRLHIPYYWARYLHDGRGRMTARSGFLVYFRIPEQDPRRFGGKHLARTRATEPHLTRDQWLAGLEANRRARAAGRQPPMIVRRSVGPASPHPFFSEGMLAFEAEAEVVVENEMDRIALEISKAFSGSFKTVIT